MTTNYKKKEPIFITVVALGADTTLESSRCTNSVHIRIPYRQKGIKWLMELLQMYVNITNLCYYAFRLHKDGAECPAVIAANVERSSTGINTEMTQARFRDE